MVPPSQYNIISAVASSAVALGMVLGPLVGGAINDSGDWRWAFLLNLPAGVVGLSIITFSLPRNFPRHCEEKNKIDISLLSKIDFLGALLLLAGTVLLIAALSEGQVRYAWNSAIIITFFVLSGVLWIIFLLWQWYSSNRCSKIQPMFPWRFLRNRAWLGVLVGSFLAGASGTVAFIEIPQRFQIVNGSSPLNAGIRLLPFAVGSPFGISVPTVMSKFGYPFIACLSIGAAFQLVGFSLLSTVPTTFNIWPGQYGYSFIAGFGSGASIGSQYIMAPLVVDAEDKNVAVGTVIQFRMLGGALGIAVANTVLNSHVLSRLTPILGSHVSTLLNEPSSIGLAPPALRDQIRTVFGEAYNLQMRAMIGFSAAQIISIMLVWKKKQIKIEKEATARVNEPHITQGDSQ
ncbi:major facilitator superfamily transporter protein [Rutstroemia sp. NJR-2017a BBW]|nr:major facilitator superfamily transporter protein [Rutstroemia sp. NJR-2017a BBW]